MVSPKLLTIWCFLCFVRLLVVYLVVVFISLFLPLTLSFSHFLSSSHSLSLTSSHPLPLSLSPLFHLCTCTLLFLFIISHLFLWPLSTKFWRPPCHCNLHHNLHSGAVTRSQAHRRSKASGPQSISAKATWKW